MELVERVARHLAEANGFRHPEPYMTQARSIIPIVLEEAAKVAGSHYMWAGKPDYVPACRAIEKAIRSLGEV